jgi:hypothetical protein
MSTVKLQSSDEQEFEVEKAVAQMSVTIKNMLEGIASSNITNIAVISLLFWLDRSGAPF